jgi:hypothetical protein
VANRGRPTKYQKAYAKQAYKLCLLGATNEELAEFFEVSHGTISNWLAEHSDFLGAVKKGRRVADAEIADSLYQRAKGYTHASEEVFQYKGDVVRAKTRKHYPPDTAAAFIWLKNRQPEKWRDKPAGDGSDSRLDEVWALLQNGPAKRKTEAGTEAPPIRGEGA